MLVSNETAKRRLKSLAAVLVVLSLLPFLFVQAHDVLPAPWPAWAIATGEHLHPFSLLHMTGIGARLPALAQAYLDWLGAFETLAFAIGLPICVVGLIANRDRWSQVAMPPVLVLFGGAFVLVIAHGELRRLSDLEGSGAQLILALLCVAMLLLLIWAIVLAFKPPPQRFGRVHEYSYGIGGDGDGDGGGGDGGSD